MNHAMNDTMSESAPCLRSERTDAGFSVLEILLAIMLLGVVGVAGLTALSTSINSSRITRDHANAHAWLQSAVDVLYGMEREDCGTTTFSREATLRDNYEDWIRDNTTNPENWDEDLIEVVAPVRFWDGTSTYQSTCYDDAGINLQLVQIRVRAPDGRIVETVEIVKG